MRRLALVAALAGAACAERVERRAEETVPLPAMSRLDAEIHHADVRVVGSQGPPTLVIERRAAAFSADAAEAALDRIAVRTGEVVTTFDRGAGVPAFLYGERVSLRLTFRVPPATPVRIRNQNGDLDLEGLAGPVDALTADGRVFARAVGSDAAVARLRSGDGRIEGTELAGRIEAETADGSIRLEGRLRRVTAITANGRIEVDARESDALLDGWLLRSADGGVALALPDGVPARLDVIARREGGPFFRDGPEGAPRVRIHAPEGRVRLP